MMSRRLSIRGQIIQAHGLQHRSVAGCPHARIPQTIPTGKIPRVGCIVTNPSANPPTPSHLQLIPDITPQSTYHCCCSVTRAQCSVPCTTDTPCTRPRTTSAAACNPDARQTKLPETRTATQLRLAIGDSAAVAQQLRQSGPRRRTPSLVSQPACMLHVFHICFMLSTPIVYTNLFVLNSVLQW